MQCMNDHGASLWLSRCVSRGVQWPRFEGSHPVFVCSVKTWAVSDSIENMKICCAICGCIDTVCEFIVEAFAEILIALRREEFFFLFSIFCECILFFYNFLIFSACVRVVSFSFFRAHVDFVVVPTWSATRPASPGNLFSARRGNLQRVVSHFQSAIS